MAHALQDMVHRLARVVARDGLAHLPDAELLRRFAEGRDPAAFEVLVWRHGAMVRNVCGRVLRRDADADDAFQATFLVLVRHATSVRRGTSLAGWLYRVARHVSLRMSRQRARRTHRERQVARAEAVLVRDAERSDWRELLDEEVERLPSPYREAFILCQLEGRAHADAARELGCPSGTLHSRLARAKERLRARLQRRGFAMPAVAAAAVSARLVQATVSNAIGSAERQLAAASAATVALSQGVWNAMPLIKAKCALVFVAAVTALGAGAVVLDRTPAAAAPAAASAAPAGPGLEELKRENERLRREVASLKRQLALVQEVLDDPPNDAEVLRAMSKLNGEGVFRNNITITKEKVFDRLDPPRFYPLLGPAQFRHRHWKCTVHFTVVAGDLAFPIERNRKGVEVVYIDKDWVVPATEGAK